MVDHTFVYTGAVHKIRDLVASGELGRILYFDSVRINLGLFQPDFNVIWDLAPHDLTIMDYVVSQTLGTPREVGVSAIGASHYGRHENLAYLTVGFDNEMIAHVHVNWVAPVKTRRTIIAGDKKMVVWDDTSPVEPVKVYESSVDVQHIDKDTAYALNVQYRSGDVTRRSSTARKRSRAWRRRSRPRVSMVRRHRRMQASAFASFACSKQRRSLWRPGSEDQAVKVPFVDLVAWAKPSREEYLAAFANVIDTGSYVGGPQVAQFE